VKKNQKKERESEGEKDKKSEKQEEEEEGSIGLFCNCFFSLEFHIMFFPSFRAYFCVRILAALFSSSAATCV